MREVLPRYVLYYWPGIQGRGEFIRLALEDAGADYVNRPPQAKYRAYAPPYLKAGSLVIGQTAAILHFLSKDKSLWLLQQQLTILDWLDEVHNVHHPVGSGLYYQQQKAEAKRYARQFLSVRLPKYLNYFERNIGPYSYVHLSLFQMIEGLRYAFPRAMKRLEPKKLSALHDRIAKRPRIAAYLASGRRIPFNQWGIFRHYPELDRP